jgi:hypothetical protein
MSNKKYMSFNTKDPSSQLGQFEKIGILAMDVYHLGNFKFGFVHVCP